MPRVQGVPHTFLAFRHGKTCPTADYTPSTVRTPVRAKTLGMLGFKPAHGWVTDRKMHAASGFSDAANA